MGKIVFFLLGVFFGFVGASDLAGKHIKKLKDEYELKLTAKEVEYRERESQMLSEQTAYLKRLADNLEGKRP